MAIDLDTILLDRVFQPVADAAVDWTSNFGLARFALYAGMALYTGVLAWNLAMANGPATMAVAIGAGLVSYGGAQQLRSQIAAAERQVRPGLMNIRRVTMRLFRGTFLSMLFLSALLIAMPFRDAGCVCLFLGNLCWLVMAYFMACSSGQPSRRSRRIVPAFAGAR